MTATDQSRQLAEIAARAADEKLGEHIAVYDVSDVMAISDVFVVVTADNERQVRAVCEEIEDELSKAGREPLRREGNREFRWVLLDYGQFVVHVQRPQEREFYGLDRLYADCPLLDVEGLDTFVRPGHYSDAVNTRQVETIEEIPLAGQAPGDDEI
ncbi:ribosome silencing factor [Corynebacterium uterequi]|uniref:Ribosomal silencing factor RsfS n=1 Tax=Corynebacterium uterequi TaxID=1072256 RepID=A0A0G3HKJ3_9CORY|nr:ribosome silencing factor [Corynebacterium uterequi]AKK11622.1 ribosome silencing factor RsfS/YbeB/iojap [Corynebacterium uterequi]